jgi:hypothetical protein
MGNKTVDNVYCDFTKSINDAGIDFNCPTKTAPFTPRINSQFRLVGFQKMIGYVDVKTSPVYFYAQKTSNFWTLNTVIPFDFLRLNLGNAMNTNGIFVAPIPGKYFFSYSGISDNSVVGRVELQMKTATKDWFLVGQAFGSTTYQTYSLQSTLQLAKGDQIRLVLREGGIHDRELHYTNFVGQLLEEEIMQ